MKHNTINKSVLPQKMILASYNDNIVWYSAK